MRPQFHFTATGWINDPHGITVHDGRYHSFFQFVPGRAEWAIECRWGHAVGRDLLSLAELPPVLAPGDGDAGIWTGTLVVDDDERATIFYTSTALPELGIGRVRTASPLEGDWVDWKKGPVVVQAPDGLSLTEFRDPFIVRDDDGWRMLIGGSDDDRTALAISWRSDDLQEWEYEGVALSRSTHERSPIWAGDGWECPQVVRLGDRDVMVFSVWQTDQLHHAACSIGTWAGGVFTPDDWQRLSYGPSPYAPSCFTDAAGQPGILFWLRDVTGDGWAGAHSIPFTLDFEGDTVVMRPHADLERYAVDDDDAPGPRVAEWDPAEDGTLSVKAGDEVLATFEADGAEIVVRIGPEQWRMPQAGVVTVIVDGPVLEVSGTAGLFGAPLPPRPDTRIAGAGRIRRLARPSH